MAATIPSGPLLVQLPRAETQALADLAERRGLTPANLASRALAAYVRAPWRDGVPDGLAVMVRGMHQLGFNARQIGVATGMSADQTRTRLRQLEVPPRRGPARLDMELTDYLRGREI